MGLFFKSGQAAIHVQSTNSNKQDLIEQKSAEIVEAVEPSKPIWGRLIFATVILITIFIGCIYCARDEKLIDLYKLLLYSFELLLGAFIGILTGELVSKNNS